MAIKGTKADSYNTLRASLVARAAPADELPIEDVPAEQHYTLIWYELFGIQLHLDFSRRGSHGRKSASGT